MNGKPLALAHGAPLRRGRAAPPRLDMLAYLLGLAKLEAEAVVRGEGPPRSPPP